MWEQLSFRDLSVILYACRKGSVKPYDLVNELGFGVGTAYNAIRKLAVNGLLIKEGDKFVPIENAWELLEKLESEIRTALKESILTTTSRG